MHSIAYETPRNSVRQLARQTEPCNAWVDSLTGIHCQTHLPNLVDLAVDGSPSHGVEQVNVEPKRLWVQAICCRAVRDAARNKERVGVEVLELQSVLSDHLMHGTQASLQSRFWRRRDSHARQAPSVSRVNKEKIDLQGFSHVNR
jgi:hypothetical protein